MLHHALAAVLFLNYTRFLEEHMPEYMQRSDGDFQESARSFHLVGPVGKTQVVSFAVNALT
jgi:hypothetical protein